MDVFAVQQVLVDYETFTSGFRPTLPIAEESGLYCHVCG